MSAGSEMGSSRQTIGPLLGGAFRIGQLTGFRGQNRTASVTGNFNMTMSSSALKYRSSIRITLEMVNGVFSILNGPAAS